ncbi:MAG: peptide deformylase [Alphaproteobacteria bacterium]|nr:peptide deformylase [Alphaproteobacteria bacterium]
MAILKIARMGHPVLQGVADVVEDPTAPEIRNLVEHMVETMNDANGIGLAATQVYVPKRVVIFEVPEERDAEAVGTPLTVLINPTIEPLAEDLAMGWEGCLSVPGLRGLVPRYTKIRYSGWGLSGERIDRIAEGMHARVVQHECDHLVGALYPARMTDLSKLVFETEWKYWVAPEEESDDLID